MNIFLFVCSANLLRSPTAEHVARLKGFSADSAGTGGPGYTAVRPLTLEAIARANRIVCMEQHHADFVHTMAPDRAVEVWNIPDNFAYCEPELIRRIEFKLRQQ